jgi:alkylation response protein AidB-like acyl-CoA dehydrogenase
MDFSFSEEQRAVADAARVLFSDLVDADRVAAAELTPDVLDSELWHALADAELLGLAVPESHGGLGAGLVELCLLLQAQGEVVAPVPLWATLVLGALPLARFGHPMQQRRWLPKVAAGEVLLTAALTSSAHSVIGRPSVEATPHVGGWVLSGVERAVPQAHLAARILVPARTPDGGVLIALLNPSSPGVTLEQMVTTNREIHPHLHLTHASILSEDILVGPESGRAALDEILVAAKTALCALQVGVCDAALRQTVDYLNGHTRFGRPLSTFEVAPLKAADASIDIEAMRVTLWLAAWLFDVDEDATDAAEVAKWHASEGGHRVVRAIEDLHGVVGIDSSHPIHRSLRWSNQIELLLGGPSRQLSDLGARIAARALTGSPS